MTGDEQVERRRTFQGLTPGLEPCSVIVVRMGHGVESRVWLSFHGIAKTTAVLRLSVAGELADALREAAA